MAQTRREATNEALISGRWPTAQAGLARSHLTKAPTPAPHPVVLSDGTDGL